MQSHRHTSRAVVLSVYICVAWMLGFALAGPEFAMGHSNYKTAFMAEYPSAIGSRLDTLPSRPNHCGLCHYSFVGGGTRNAYGNRFNAVKGGFSNNETGFRAALRSIENEDNDGDGATSIVEILDLAHYSNTPTFPGLNSATVVSILAVSAAEVTPYVTPIPVACATCLGDVDGNAVRDARDIQGFARCTVEGAIPGAGCLCSDMDGNGALNQTDVELFLAGLLGQTPTCP